MSKEVNKFQAGYPLEIQALITHLRSLVLDIYPATLEQADVSARIIGYGKDHTYRGMVCAIAPQREYVNLMFARGTELSDPERLLEGTGKHARHVKIRSEADISRPAVHDLLREAVKLMERDSNG